MFENFNTKITPLSMVQQRGVEYLDEPYIIQSIITGLCGDPGVGKSTSVRELLKNFSVGYSSFTNKKIKTINSLLLTNEDSKEHVLAPRLEKVGADLNRIYIYDDIIYLDPLKIKELESIIQENNIQFLVIDPIVAYIDPKKDMNKATDVRTLMSNLIALARNNNISILCLRHLNKNTDSSNLIYRGQGSVDFTGGVRSEFHLVLHPEDENKRILIHSKSNYGQHLPSIEFYIDELGIRNISRSHITASNYLQMSKGVSKITLAKMFLTEVLSSGPIESNLLNEMAKDEGITLRTLERAKKRLCESFRNENEKHWNTKLNQDRQMAVPENKEK